MTSRLDHELDAEFEPGLVPVIDLRGEPESVAGEIDAACRRVGFFQIVGHGLDPGIERWAWDLAHDFFHLPAEEKLALSIPPGDAYGYGPFKVERLAASLGAATPPDLKETFSVGPFMPPVAAAADDEFPIRRRRSCSRPIAGRRDCRRWSRCSIATTTRWPVWPNASCR